MNGKINESMWRDPGFLTLSPAEKLALVWCLTSGQPNCLGVFQYSQEHFRLETGVDHTAFVSMCEAMPDFLIPLPNKKRAFWMRNWIAYQIGSGLNLVKNNIAKGCVNTLLTMPPDARNMICEQYPELQQVADKMQHVTQALRSPSKGSPTPPKPSEALPRGPLPLPRGKSKSKSSSYSSPSSSSSSSQGGRAKVGAKVGAEAGLPEIISVESPIVDAPVTPEVVVKEGATGIRVPEGYCRYFHARKNSKQSWDSKRVPWRLELREWWAKDRLRPEWATHDPQGNSAGFEKNGGGEIQQLRAKLGAATDPQRMNDLQDQLDDAIKRAEKGRFRRT